MTAKTSTAMGLEIKTTEQLPLNTEQHHANKPGFEPLLEEAARLLRVHPKTLLKWAREGKVPGAHYGGRWFFRAPELDAWVQSQLHLPRHACRKSEEIR